MNKEPRFPVTKFGMQLNTGSYCIMKHSILLVQKENVTTWKVQVMSVVHE